MVWMGKKKKKKKKKRGKLKGRRKKKRAGFKDRRKRKATKPPTVPTLNNHTNRPTMEKCSKIQYRTKLINLI